MESVRTESKHLSTNTASGTLVAIKQHLLANHELSRLPISSRRGAGNTWSSTGGIAIRGQHNMNSNSILPASSSGRNGCSKKAKPVRHHIKISIEDLNWTRAQKSCVQQLWLDCCAVEQFGKQLRKLETNLSDKSFRIAKTTLEKQGLFKFEPIVELSSSGRTKVIDGKLKTCTATITSTYKKDMNFEKKIISSSLVANTGRK